MMNKFDKINHTIILEGLLESHNVKVKTKNGNYFYKKDNGSTVIIHENTRTLLESQSIKDVNTLTLKKIGEKDYYTVGSDCSVIAVYNSENKDMELFDHTEIAERVQSSEPLVKLNIIFLLGDCCGGLNGYEIKDQNNQTVGIYLTEEEE
jgi:hypothetical protein